MEDRVWRLLEEESNCWILEAKMVKLGE